MKYSQDEIALRGDSAHIAWGYVRVSGDAQADRGLPVAGQRQAIADYAAQRALAVERWFVDEARPGSSDARPAFQAMMAAAHRDPPPCDVILLWSWSRFSRDEADAVFWKASLRRHGVAIQDVSGETPDVPGMEYVVESLIHWRDAQRLREISADARRGQQTLARLGYIPSGCAPPRGFMVAFEQAAIEGRTRRLRRWVRDPATWNLARRAWELRRQRLSYRAILDACPGLFRAPASLVTFFANTIYKGYTTFGGARIEVERMVTDEEWDEVQAMKLPPRGGDERRRRGSRYLLSGLLRCARCGARLLGDVATAHGGHAEWRMYVCASVKRRQGCDLPRLGAVALEQAVTGAVFTTLLDEDTLRAQREALVAEMAAQRPQSEERLALLRKERTQAQARARRLLDAIEEGGETQLLAERLREREGEAGRLGREIAVLERELAGPPQAFDVASFREELHTAVAAGDPREARRLLGQFVAEVVVDAETLQIRYHVPF